MDIAYFISDLLGEQGELSVPNLGYFVQLRMGAYYNEEEKKFYPPHYAVQFDPQVIDDDETLAAHITERKKISLASAKYFIEKYITGLREQALNEDVPFGGIGYFSSNGIQLVFKPDAKTDDPSFFGFKPVKAYRIGDDIPATVAPQSAELPEAVTAPVAVPVEIEKPGIVDTAPVAAYTPPPVEPPVTNVFTPQLPVQEETESPYVYEEERRGISTWLIVAIVLALLVAAAAALYKFKPELFKELSLHKDPYQNTAVAVKDSSKTADTTAVNAPTVSKPDTANRQPATSTPDTVVQPVNTAVEKPAAKVPEKATTVKSAAKKPAATPVVTTVPASTAPASSTTTETIAKGKWVIYGGTHPERKPALRILENYKSLGLTQARFLKDNVKAGNNYKVVLGVFNTKQEAVDASKEIMATAKVSAKNLSIEKL